MGARAEGQPVGRRFDRPDEVTRLYRAYARDVRELAARTYLRADAEDIVQETFITVGLRLAAIPEHKERAWVLGVARNVIRNSRRSRRRRDQFTAALATVLPKVVDGLGAEQPSAELKDAFGRAFARLPSGDQEILLLAAWHGLEAAEIAVVLGVRTERASDRLYRARKRIRAHYDREGGE